MFIFSFILAAIIALVKFWIRPYAMQWMPNLTARILTTAIALLLMAPFLTGLAGRNILPSVTADSIKNTLKTTSAKTGGKLRSVLPYDRILSYIKRLFPHLNIRKRLNVSYYLLRRRIFPKKQEDEANTEKHKFMMPQHLKTVIHDNTATVKGSVKNIISKDSVSRIYTDLWFANKIYRPSLLILTSIRMLVVSFFIVTAVHQFLTENPKVIFLLLLASIWLIMRSQWLFNQYIKIENHFLDNLNGDNEPAPTEE